jgi:hypothetical protein
LLETTARRAFFDAAQSPVPAAAEAVLPGKVADLPLRWALTRYFLASKKSTKP